VIHFLVAVWISTIGVAATAPAAKWLTPIGTAALAPAIGTAIYVVIGVLLAATDAFTTLTALTVATAVTVSLVVAYFVTTGAEPPYRQILIGGGLALGLVAAVSLIALNVHATRFTNDSYRYLMAASWLEQTHGIESIDNRVLVAQQLVVPLIHTTGWITGDGYTPVLTPLFGAATIATMGWLSIRVLQAKRVSIKWQFLLLSAASLLLLTTNRFVTNLTYINGHMLFALLLLIAIGLAWLGLVEQEHRYLYVVGIALAGLAITRTEAMIVIALFLIPILSDRRMRTHDRLLVTAPAVGLASIWFGLVLPRHTPDSGVGSSVEFLYGNVIIALLLLAFAIVAGLPGLRKMVVLSPWLLIGGVLALLGYYTYGDPQILIQSISSIALNAAYWGFWGSFWYVVLPLTAAAMISGIVESDRLWNFGLIGFVLTLPLMAYLRESGYRVGSGDSANRMLVHIVPLLVVYLVFTAGQASVDLTTERKAALTQTTTPTSA